MPPALTAVPSSEHQYSREEVLQMQRAYGNAFVQRWLAGSVRTTGDTTSQPSSDSIQRDSDTTPEEDFLNDLKSGTEQAGKYVDYITKAVEYWQKTGDKPVGLANAAKNLVKITSSIKSGLDKFGSAIGKAKQLLEIKTWADSLADFAGKTIALDLTDRESVEAWVGSLKKSIEKSKPLSEAVQGWLKSLAFKGSHVAGRASLVFSVVTAYIEVGAAALDAGVKVVNAYHERREKYLKGIEERPKKETPPTYPGDWSTSAERRATREAYERYMREVARQREEERKRNAAIRDFNENKFVSIYLKNRAKLKHRIWRDYRAGKREWTMRIPGGTMKAAGIGEGRWWDCFLSSDRDSYFDSKIGAYVQPKMSRVNREGAEYEISNFQHVKPPCPYFDDLYKSELEKHIEKTLKKEASLTTP